MAYFDGRNPDELARLRQMIGPQQVDNQIRQAIGVCWMMLPPEKQTADELEAHGDEPQPDGDGNAHEGAGEDQDEPEDRPDGHVSPR